MCALFAMISRAVMAALACGLWGLACSSAASRSTGAGPHKSEVIGPTQYDAEIEQAKRHGGQAEAPNIDFREPVTSLEEAILRAYWHNPEVLAGRARKRAADYRLPQARALYGPRVDYEIAYSYRRDRIEFQPDQFRTASGWTKTVSAVIDQPLATFGRLAANERRASAEIGFERATLEYTEQQVTLATIEAYAAVVRDRNAVRIAQENLDLLTKTLSDSEQRFNAREATLVDFRQVGTRRKLASAELQIATGRLATSEGRFLAITGSAPADELAPIGQLVQPVPTLDSALRIALSQNPLVEAAHYREQISRAVADAAVAERLPRVDLRGRADLAPTNDYDDRLRQTTYVGQVVLSGPLFTSGLLAARQREAVALNDADWRLIDAARRNLIEELTSAWKTREASRQSLQSYATAVEAAREAYLGAVAQQKAGFRTTLDVLILAGDILLVENGRNSARYEEYMAQARTLFALGMLNLSDLMADQPSYNAAVHLDAVDGQGSFFPVTPFVRLLDGGLKSPVEPRESRDPVLGVGSFSAPQGDNRSR